MRGLQIALLIAVFSLIAAGGCGPALVGTWKADPIPSGEPFYVKQVTFEKGGDYTAAAKRGDENQRLHGKYEFDGFTLKLRAAGKNDRNYRATLWWGNTLKLTSDDKTYTLKKQ